MEGGGCVLYPFLCLNAPFGGAVGMGGLWGGGSVPYPAVFLNAPFRPSTTWRTSSLGKASRPRSSLRVSGAQVLAAAWPRSWQLCYCSPGSHVAKVLAAAWLRSWQPYCRGPGSCVTKVLAAALPWQPCCWAPCCSVLGDGDVSFPPQCSPASCWLFLPPVSSTACASPRGTCRQSWGPALLRPPCALSTKAAAQLSSPPPHSLIFSMVGLYYINKISSTLYQSAPPAPVPPKAVGKGRKRN